MGLLRRPITGAVPPTIPYTSLSRRPRLPGPVREAVLAQADNHIGRAQATVPVAVGAGEDEALVLPGPAGCGLLDEMLQIQMFVYDCYIIHWR